MSYEQELRKQTELMRRMAQTQRINTLYGGKKGKGVVIGGGNLDKLTKEDWDEHRRILYTEGGDAAKKFLDKKSGALPVFAPLAIFFAGLVVFSLLYSWYLLTFYGG